VYTGKTALTASCRAVVAGASSAQLSAVEATSRGCCGLSSTSSGGEQRLADTHSICFHCNEKAERGCTGVVLGSGQRGTPQWVLFSTWGGRQSVKNIPTPRISPGTSLVPPLFSPISKLFNWVKLLKSPAFPSVFALLYGLRVMGDEGS
jgi:hypothetical protein